MYQVKKQSFKHYCEERHVLTIRNHSVSQEQLEICRTFWNFQGSEILYCHLFHYETA
jgi:hypothetical protein